MGTTACFAQLDTARPSHFEIIVNATPVGMTGQLEHEALFKADQLSGVKLVYDLVTKTGDTPLIAEAKKADVPTIGGMAMLIAQAEMQFEIWTGQRPKPRAMENSISTLE